MAPVEYSVCILWGEKSFAHEARPSTSYIDCQGTEQDGGATKVPFRVEAETLESSHEVEGSSCSLARSGKDVTWSRGWGTLVILHEELLFSISSIISQ
jgi:hypothetical protein